MICRKWTLPVQDIIDLSWGLQGRNVDVGLIQDHSFMRNAAPDPLYLMNMLQSSRWSGVLCMRIVSLGLMRPLLGVRVSSRRSDAGFQESRGLGDTLPSRDSRDSGPMLIYRWINSHRYNSYPFDKDNFIVLTYLQRPNSIQHPSYTVTSANIRNLLRKTSSGGIWLSFRWWWWYRCGIGCWNALKVL